MCWAVYMVACHFAKNNNVNINDAGFEPTSPELSKNSGHARFLAVSEISDQTDGLGAR